MPVADHFDVILFGPTGVTGREVARYLARRAPEVGCSWAVAGRDPDRIAATLASVGAVGDAAPAEILRVDATDPASVDAMVARATVIADLVGPFATYGEAVYEACARRGVHLVDPCGETDWVASMIGRHDDVATASGAVMVPTAGFEALPFDLGALVAASRLHERTGAAVCEVDVAVSITGDVRLTSASDAVSGGTYASAVDSIRRGGGRSYTDPHVLDTSPPAKGHRYDLRPRKHPGTGQWLAPMFPSPFLNPAVVHRSASLLRDSGDTIHGSGFLYREGTVTEAMVPGPVAAVAASSLAALSAGLGLLARAPAPVRRVMADLAGRVGPRPGDGPKVEDLDRWSYRLDVRATDVTGGTQDVVVEGDGHPGYKSTATMLGEAALLLADPAAGLPEGAGFLTPATALGLVSVPRFGEAGLRFLVD